MESMANLSRLSVKSKSKTAKSQLLEPPVKEATNKEILYIYYFISKMLSDSSFLFSLEHIPFNHAKTTSILCELSKIPTFNTPISFL
jgi:hypothetical protein